MRSQADVGTDADEAVYLYGFVSDSGAASGLPPALPAVDPERPLGLYRHAGLIALVSPVRRTDFDGDDGAANLADIGWVGPRALRHQAVLDAALAEAAVYPLPFGTLFSSPAALAAEMELRRDDIGAALARLAGCAEWAVQGELDRDAALDALVRDAIVAGDWTPPAAPGRRHLEEQRLRRELDAELDNWAEAAAATLADALAAASRGHAQRRIPAGQTLAFNWAFLVPTDGLDDFHAAIDTTGPVLAGHGLRVVCKGPWPGYSFVAAAS
ncbi:GvpL/GvpF family gas vesicle protein [Thiohalocapsa sp. ML1]|jgi:hypothetical protein|uniref:GvpL/GvpF family gas vesicle protein n=1 Tax=Thiohalocapsa sp. ML1 TaxID=1431688 RepID=UPI000731FF18|nr:GvpL/GvpF family gas vesicle protein [Thiohalocapsa sp. ML1]